MLARDPVWPDKVVPESGDEVRRATRLLFDTLGWSGTDPIRTETLAVLQRWFDAGWCPAAVLVALEQTPDGMRQRRRDHQEDVESFLNDRLKPWFRDDPGSERDARLPPPRPAMSYQQWEHIVRQDRERSAVRPRQTLGQRGQEARQRAREQARQARRDSLARGQDKDERIANAFASLDALLPQEITPSTTGPQEKSADSTPHRPTLVASYAGRRATLAHHPTVRTIVQRVLDEQRRPTREELQVLRNAASEAKSQAAVGTLDAALAETRGGVLSEQALRIVSYLDHASHEDVPLDSMLTLLDTHVHDALGDRS